MLDLNEITTVCRALDDRLGPQEWTLDGPTAHGLYDVYDGDGNRFFTGVEEVARFIACARTWLPALVEELRQAREELAVIRAGCDAVDESPGKFYAPVLDPETDEPCGSFWKDHGAWHAIEVLGRARQELAAVLEHNKELFEALDEEKDEVVQAMDLAAIGWAEVKRLRTLVPPPELLYRLAEWANEAVLDGGDCLGEDMGTEEYPNTDDVEQARTLARRIEETQANDRT